MDHNNTLHEWEDCAERVEPGELLDDYWFFGNLLHTKSRIPRSFSNPCTTSNYAQEENFPGESYEETYRSIEKLYICDREIDRQSLIRATSVPPILQRRDQKSGPRTGKSSKKTTKSSTCLNREHEKFEDEEVEFSMGKLIRQASMNYSDTLPPRTRSTKGLTRSHSTRPQGSRRKLELESIKIELPEEIIRPQRPIDQLKSQKSLLDLEFEELQGFKDLGFDFDEKELSPKVISMIPALQEKRDVQEYEGTNSTARRPYLSEVWDTQSCSAPPGAKWGGKRSTEDMKTQIKFWARAVASNVRQEC